MESKDKGALAERLGARIAELRAEAGMTQSELAMQLGIGDEHVSRFERGAVLPTLPRLFDIADAFERGVDELLVGASPRIDDQANAIAHRLIHLSAPDRAFVVDIVERLVGHIASPRADRPKRR